LGAGCFTGGHYLAVSAWRDLHGKEDLTGRLILRIGTRFDEDVWTAGRTGSL
jgi:hypothetical protein